MVVAGLGGGVLESIFSSESAQSAASAASSDAVGALTNRNLPEELRVGGSSCDIGGDVV